MSRFYVAVLALLGAVNADAGAGRLESRYLTVEVDRATGAWALTDVRSGVRWPTAGMARAGGAEGFPEGFAAAREEGFHLGLVHERRVEVADLLGLGAGCV